MYFLIDSKTSKIEAHRNMGYAARSVLKTMNIKVNQPDPVKMLSEHGYFSQRFTILNLAGAFDAIARSDNYDAQELANNLRSAVDAYYSKKTV